MTDSLAEALPREMARVRDEVMPAYAGIGPAGGPGLMMMRASIDAATKAIMEGDVVAMIRSLKDLQEWHL